MKLLLQLKHPYVKNIGLKGYATIFCSALKKKFKARAIRGDTITITEDAIILDNKNPRKSEE